MPHLLGPGPDGAHTDAARRALAGVVDRLAVADVRFLEDWERRPVFGSAAMLRMRQLRRAQPALAAEVRAEVVQRQQRLTGAGRPPARPGPPPGPPPGPGRVPDSAGVALDATLDIGEAYLPSDSRAGRVGLGAAEADGVSSPAEAACDGSQSGMPQQVSAPYEASPAVLLCAGFGCAAVAALLAGTLLAPGFHVFAFSNW